jgi:hypothetical protein
MPVMCGGRAALIRDCASPRPAEAPSGASTCREQQLIGEIGNLGYRRPIRDIGRLTMMQARTSEAAFCRASLEGQAAFRGRALSGARLA